MCRRPGAVVAESTRVQGELIRDVLNENATQLPRLQPRRNPLEPLERGV